MKIYSENFANIFVQCDGLGPREKKINVFGCKTGGSVVFAH